MLNCPHSGMTKFKLRGACFLVFSFPPQSRDTYVRLLGDTGFMCVWVQAVLSLCQSV